MPITSQDLANQALQYMGGNQPPVQGLWPSFVGTDAQSTTAARALNILYGACVATVQRGTFWDASRRTIALTRTANTPRLYAFQYLYPGNGIQVWQLAPATDADPNDPLPVNYDVANDIVNGAQAKVIETNLANAWAIYNNNPNESVWDPDMREAVARLLASEVAMAIGGKPDLSQSLLQSGSGFENIGEGRRN